LKEHVAEEELSFISGGLKGMAETILSFYPKAQYQSCLVHISRHLSHKVCVSEREEVYQDFKAVYQVKRMPKRICRISVRSGQNPIQKSPNHYRKTLIFSLFTAFLNRFGEVFILPI
jgi:hypothetical protein